LADFFMDFSAPQLQKTNDFMSVPLQYMQRVGKGFMADKPGTYSEGPEYLGESLAFAPTPLMAGSMALKGTGRAAQLFGNALKGARKYIPMHTEDIQDLSPVLERYMTKDDPMYYLTQRIADEKLIKDVAGHYIGKDILKMYEKAPQNIAQELLNRLISDRMSIPKVL
jgi:hypothetical protein